VLQSRYRIRGSRGRGGQGRVYVAESLQLGRQVAVKEMLEPEGTEDRDALTSAFQAEARLLAGLDHPGLPRVYDFFHENGRFYLIMEFIDGHNLKKHIEDRDLTMKQMVEVCLKLSHGLDFLHQNGIVHRDVKPGNFLFSRDGMQVKIVDFGLSKSTASWRTRWMTESGGTRLYMSPEQLQKRALDARSDIFSFGITMFELFTGRHPCDGSDTREIQKQLLSSSYKFEPLSKYNPEVPKHLDRVILKALQRKLNKRYQSMTEMLLDLSRMGTSRI